jgi:hypothetical protein
MNHKVKLLIRYFLIVVGIYFFVKTGAQEVFNFNIEKTPVITYFVLGASCVGSYFITDDEVF